MRSLFAHQRDALAYASTRSRIALFMEMRLGKSLVAIRWLRSRHPLPLRVLVVGPVSVLPGWIDELKLEGVDPADIHWLTGPVVGRLETASRVLAAPTTTQWCLTNYEIFVGTGITLLEEPWSALLLDESTRIRNPQAKTTKRLIKYGSQIPYAAILSGLPDPESTLDFFEQFRFLHGAFLGKTSYWQFRHRYFSQRGYEWAPRPGVVKRVREAVHTNAFVLTRKDAHIGSRKIYETRSVEMLPAQRKAYREVVKHFRYEKEETKWITTKLIWMARIASGHEPVAPFARLTDTKLNELLSLMKGELRGQPLVIWFRFNSELATVYHRLRREGYRVAGILGATPPAVRHARRLAFQHDKLDVLLIQVKCGRYGLDCSRADTAIYYSNSYDYEDRAQSEDRIVHGMKTRPLLYVDLVTRGTVDEAVVRTLRGKKMRASVFMSKLLTTLAQVHYGQT